MKLYHGTNCSFDKISLDKSRPNKDFGKGFYLSSDLSQAKEMAMHKVLQEEGIPLVLTYEFDESVLAGENLKVKIFDSYSIEWVEFILANRTNTSSANVHDYDIVVGPIADDKVGVQIFRYLNDYIDIHKLVENLKYKKITTQYFFGTEKALSLLSKL
ncbi:MAG: DUF3990 domain-containing protein [Clostridium sp.]|nr:DUF3990 domain-containing protein [Clostridium sp.]